MVYKIILITPDLVDVIDPETFHDEPSDNPAENAVMAIAALEWDYLDWGKRHQAEDFRIYLQVDDHAPILQASPELDFEGNSLGVAALILPDPRQMLITC